MGLTSARFRRSRHGMTLLLNTGGYLRETPEDGHPVAMALLGMKLRPHDVAPLDRRDEVVSVVSGGRDVGRLVADDMVRVHEVELGFGIQSAEERVPLGGVDGIPSHVGHFQTGSRGIW